MRGAARAQAPDSTSSPLWLQLAWLALLAARIAFPYFDSPFAHLYSDPLRHWDGGRMFLHPDVMGANDPFLYQLWMFSLQSLAQGSNAVVLAGCSLLCALMPWGWYRALRELLPRTWALGGALLIGLTPESISVYAYFMNETLLMTLLGLAAWLTLRSRRCGTLWSFVLAALVWICASMTRTVALPLAAASLAWLWWTQPQRRDRAAAACAIALALIVPAGLHAQSVLGFFAPFGNLYFNAIYNRSGAREIAVDYGVYGQYQFGAPSFFNPTLAPFSDWKTARTGVARIRIETATGRSSWQRELTRIEQQRTFPYWRQRGEDLLYLLFAPVWPNSNPEHWINQLTLWGRWLWPALILVVAAGMVRGRFSGDEWFMPLGALGTVVLLALQSEGVMEGRFREPFDPFLLASVLLMLHRYGGERRPAALELP